MNLNDITDSSLERLVGIQDQYYSLFKESIRYDLMMDESVCMEIISETEKMKTVVIHESSFSNYYLSIDYIKAKLLQEAAKIFLSEIAPVRKRKPRIVGANK